MDDYIIEGFVKAASLQSEAKVKCIRGDLQKIVNRWNTGRTATSEIVVAESILDNLFGKKAQSTMDEESCKLLSMYVAFTRALYLLHQQNHWEARNYGNHLLFQRLYEDAQEMADDAAERVMGLCGKIQFDGHETVITKKFEAKEKTHVGLVQSSLSIEKAFQDVAKKVYDTLKEKDVITLGLDDLIMGQASDSEVHLYLLQQALKGHEES